MPECPAQIAPQDLHARARTHTHARAQVAQEGGAAGGARQGLYWGGEAGA
jgi:hypothetical protein